MEVAEGIFSSSTLYVILQGVEFHVLDSEPGGSTLATLGNVLAVSEPGLLTTCFPLTSQPGCHTWIRVGFTNETFPKCYGT